MKLDWWVTKEEHTPCLSVWLFTKRDRQEFINYLRNYRKIMTHVPCIIHVHGMMILTVEDKTTYILSSWKDVKTLVSVIIKAHQLEIDYRSKELKDIH